MTRGHVYSIVRWMLLGAAALFVAGVWPFTTGDARGLTGAAGPVTVTVSPAVNLGDGQVVSVHAQSTQPDVVIYALRVHLCHPGMVKGDTSFSFDQPQCASTPVGQSDTEQHVTVAAAPSGDIQFKVGTGTATWITPIGLDGSLTCDAANPCDLAVQVEITNSTAYFRAPLCFGTTCPADTDPNVAPTPPVAAPPAAGSSEATKAGAAAGGATAKAGATASDGGSGPGASATTATAAAVGAAAAHGTGTSRSAAAGESADLASAQNAGVIAVPPDGPSRGLRVAIAAIAGALGGARIVTVVNKTRKRRTSLGSIA